MRQGRPMICNDYPCLDYLQFAARCWTGLLTEWFLLTPDCCATVDCLFKTRR